MNIVFYTHGLPIHGDSLEGPLGGSESALISLARALAVLGHRVTIFCPCPAPGEYGGVLYRDAGDYPSWAASGACDLFVCSRAFYVFPNVPRSPVRVLWNHDMIGPDQGPRIAYAASQCSYIYCLSRFQALHYRDILHAEMPGRREAIDRSIRIVPNGVDLDAAAAARSGATKRRRLMFTSRPERGLAQALAIFEALGDRDTEFLACTYRALGETSDAAWAHEERRIVDLQERGFRVSCAQLGKAELMSAIAESVAVLYPTCFPETFCISAVEAQACGTVFVAPAAAALSETARHAGLAGDDAEGYVRLLRRLLDDPAYRREREREGVAHVRHCDWALIARRFVADAAAHGEREAASAATPSVAQPAVPRPPGPPEQPEVTCITAAAGSLLDVKRAIEAYCAQTYRPRRLALLLSCGTGRLARSLHRHLDLLGRSDIDLVARDAPLPSTALRCRWSATDLHHPERLELQVRHLLAGAASGSCLSDALSFDDDARILTWTDASRDGLLTGAAAAIPGTLLTRDAAASSWSELAGLLPEEEDALAGGDVAALAGAGWA